MTYRKYICLQFTNTRIRAIGLQSHQGSWKITVSGERQLPEALDGTDLFHHPTLAQTVRDLFDELSLRPKNVLLSIPGNGVLFKQIQMPSFSGATASQRNAAIELDLPDHIAVSLDQAAYDWTLINQTEENTHLLMAWMRKAPLESLCTRLESIGIKPAYVMPASLVLASQLLFTADCSPRICGIHVDGDQIDLVVMEKEQVMGGRSFSMTHSPNSSVFWRTLKQSLAGVPNPTQANLDRIILFQSASSLTPEQVKQQLGGTHCDIREPSDEWALSLLKSYLHSKERSGGIHLNLLTPLLKQKADEQRQRQKGQVKRLIPLAATIALVVANVGIWNTIDSTRAQIDGFRQADAHAKLQERAIKSLKEHQQILEDQMANLTWGVRHFPPLAERLAQIAESIPKSVRLTQIKTLEPPRTAKARSKFDARETLLLAGVASSQEEIDAFRSTLSTSEGFSNVRQIKTEQVTVQGEKWLEFTLSLTSRVGREEKRN